MQTHRDPQQRRQQERQESRESRAGACPAAPGSDTLQIAVEDLRAALADEQGGNDQVRDCAFEVVEAWDAAAERTPTLETVRHLNRLLAGLHDDLAHTCRHTDVTRARGEVATFKRALLDLEGHVQRFVTTADVFRHRRRVHGRGRGGSRA